MTSALYAFKIYMGKSHSQLFNYSHLKIFSLLLGDLFVLWWSTKKKKERYVKIRKWDKANNEMHSVSNKVWKIAASLNQQNKPSFQIWLMQVAGKYKIAWLCLYTFNIISRKYVKRKVSVYHFEMQLKIHNIMHSFKSIVKIIHNTSLFCYYCTFIIIINDFCAHIQQQLNKYKLV